MKTNYTIKNFRVFDENGVKIEINPISILTGCNSSGKSSIVKSILLFNSFLSQIKEDIEKGKPVDLEKYRLDFTSYPNNLLGRFDRVVNKYSNNNEITFGYTIYSKILSKNVDVEFVFTKDDNDELNSGFLNRLTMEIDGEIFLSADKNISYINLNMIMSGLLEYIGIEELFKNLSVKSANYNIDYISKERYDNLKEEDLEVLKNFEDSRKKDVFNSFDVATKLTRISNFEILDYAYENHSLFKIDILSELDNISKNEFYNYLQENILAKFGDDEFTILGSNKIISDFVNSEYQSFSEYFKSYEEKFFQKISRNSLTIDIINSSTTISQNSFVCDTKSMLPRHTLGINGMEEVVSPQEIKEEKYCEIRDKVLDFSMLYEIIMRWNSLKQSEDNIYYTKKDEISLFFGASVVYDHKMYKHIRELLPHLIKSIICPNWVGNMSYVASSRVDVRRLYALEDKNDFTQQLKNYFEFKREFLSTPKTHNSKYDVDAFMNKWIKKFGIGDSVKFKFDDEGNGVRIFLHKETGDKGGLLADEGYGITQLVSILLQIENAILTTKEDKGKNTPLILDDIPEIEGYYQAKHRYKITTIAIEEPEIHLHPNYQSLLTDMFLEAYREYNIHFIIETHSEYLIRRSQVLVADAQYKDEEDLKNNPFKVYYVPKDGDPYDMKYRTDGKFSNEFGSGFFDEASNLAFELF